MGWDPALVPDPQDPATFTRSKLDWDEAGSGDHARLLELYRELIALRKKTPELTDPDFSAITVDFDEDARWLALHRGAVTVACNFGSGAQDLGPGISELLLATDDGIQLKDSRVHLPAKSAAILRRL